MRIISRLIAVEFFLLACCVVTNAQSATIITAGTGGRVEVNLDRLDPPPSGHSTGGLFISKDGKLTQLTSQSVPDGASDAASYRRFHFDFPAGTSYDPAESYQVVLFTPVTDARNNGAVMANTIPVTTRMKMSVKRSDIRCEGGMTVIASATHNPGQANWPAVYKWLKEYDSKPWELATVTLHVIGEDDKKDKNYPLRLFYPTTPDGAIVNTEELRLCLETEPKLPVGAFDAKIVFHGTDRPADFGPVAEGEKLGGRYVTTATKSEPADPKDRVLEQNLDLGVSFTSSVANKETPATGSTPATTTRERTNRGILDVRLAPTLNLLKPVIESNRWLHFWTPVFLNANVATGKIEEDTLSLNRVLFGTEFESRYNVRHTRPVLDKTGKPIIDTTTGKAKKQITYPMTNRFFYGLTHASDRDFKQKEFTGKIEYRPIFWKLNSPINLNYTVLSGEKRPGNFGFVFLPTVGFEIGRTYQRRNPAEAVKPSDTVRRFYFGVEMNLDVTKYLTFSVKDTFYVRGETPDDRGKNYFKGGIEAPLGPVLGSGVQSLFLSFERGDLAPFATPSVNVFKTGYRIQFNYCRKCR
jgi:hypothetical protein